jgi:carboxypeptidase Q
VFWPGTSRNTNITYVNPANGKTVVVPKHWVETASWSRSTASIQGNFVVVSNNGCQESDYAGLPIKGEIAFVRGGGSCTHYNKGLLATRMGAKAMITWDPKNQPYHEARYGGKRTPYPGTIPLQTAGIGGSAAAALSKIVLASKSSGPGAVIGSLTVYNPGVPADRTYTKNLCYETISGDKERVLVLGAHIDSVMAGPGINDNGSGVAAILEIAKQLSRFSLANRLRFCFWSGEEQGLLGSTYYVENLSPAEKNRIVAYLNFDMIGSPHPTYGIMSGTEVSHDGLVPPQGSSGLTGLWTSYFTDEKIPFEMYAFEGHTDHTAFRDAGIPIGAMNTGGMGKKTEEDVKKYGGKVGDQMDTFYHTGNDTLENVDLDALLVEARAIAHVVGVLGVDFGVVDKVKSGQRSVSEIHERSFRWRSRRRRRTIEETENDVLTQT